MHVGGSFQATWDASAGMPAWPGLSIACETRSPSGQRRLMKAITERISTSVRISLKAGMNDTASAGVASNLPYLVM